MADLAAPTRCKLLRGDQVEPMVAAAATAGVGKIVGIDTYGKVAIALADGLAGVDEPLAGIVATVDGNGVGSVTVVKKGLVDVGNVLGGLAYGALVYLSGENGGLMADAAATQVIKIGRVWPVWNNTAQPDKVLYIDV